MTQAETGTRGLTWIALFGMALAIGMAPRGLAQEPDSNRWAGGVFGIAGVDRYVYSLAQWDDGSGPALYVGGWFEHAGTMRAESIARWDGARWHALGGGASPGIVSADRRDGGVYAMAPFDDGTGPALYVAGQFEAAGGAGVSNIARWNGSSWSAVGEGLGVEGDTVTSLAAFDDGTGSHIYAALAPDRAASASIMRWDGAQWSEVVTVVGEIQVIASLDLGEGPRLVAGGEFTTIGGTPATGIAAWDGEAWSAFGSGLDGGVYDLAVYDDGTGPALHAAGDIEQSGTSLMNTIARWDGQQWHAVGDNVSGDGRSLHVFDDGDGPALYAGGVNMQAGDLPRRGLLQWDGREWTLPGGDQMGSQTFAMATFEQGGQSELIAGGLVYLDEAQGIGNIARFVGGEWRTLGSELGALYDRSHVRTVFALERFDDGTGDSLYVAGQFGIDTAAGAEPDAFQLVRWDERGWTAVGDGVAPGWPEVAVYTLKASMVADEPHLYLGGNFSMVGSVAANAIARWDGQRFAALGDGLTGGPTPTVFAIEENDDGAGSALYVGGRFTHAGGQPASNVARWDGREWSAVGEGLVGTVYALAHFDDGSGHTLYAAGDFFLADQPDAGDLVRWNGERWEPVGMSARGSGFARVLSVVDIGDGPKLYAGGRLEIEARGETTWIAQWDGQGWTDVGGHGPRGTVRAIEVFDFGSGPELVVAGGFVLDPQLRLENIARWNGQRWARFDKGLGMDPITRRHDGRALAVFDDGSGPGLFVGGDFFSAGGHVSPGIARWSLPPCRPDLDADGALTIFDFLQFQNLFDAGDPRADFDGDGALTIFDFLAFQNEFDAGC